MPTPLAYALAQLRDALEEEGVLGSVKVVLEDDDYHRFKRGVRMATEYDRLVLDKTHPVKLEDGPSNEAYFAVFDVQVERRSEEQARIGQAVRQIVDTMKNHPDMFHPTIKPPPVKKLSREETLLRHKLGE